MKGKAYYMLNKYGQAIESYHKAIEIDRHDAASNAIPFADISKVSYQLNLHIQTQID